jgi:glycine/serine hydroxymethyltransferase
MHEAEMAEIADLIVTKLGAFDDPAVHDAVRGRSLALCRRFPLPYRSAPS